jgi:hypothetical protein
MEFRVRASVAIAGRSDMEVGREEEEPEKPVLAEVFFWSRVGRTWRWEHWGAVFGYMGAALAGLVGMCLPAAVAFGISTDGTGSLTLTSTLLLLAVIPLMLFGAHCLDRLEALVPADALPNASSGTSCERGADDAPVPPLPERSVPERGEGSPFASVGSQRP